MNQDAEIVSNFAKVYALAKSGDANGARVILAETQKRYQHMFNDEMNMLTGMAHYLTGDADGAILSLLRVTNHNADTLATLSACAHAKGHGQMALKLRHAASRLGFGAGFALEDMLPHDDLENYQLPIYAERCWGDQMRHLARGGFDVAAAEMLRVADALPSCSPGAASVRLRSGRMLPLWRGECVERLAVIFADGHGDTFFFARYLAGLRSRVRHLSLVASDPTAPVLRRSFPGAELAGFADCSALLNGADAYAHPWLLPSQSGEQYGAARWVIPEPGRVRAWREIRDDRALNVGIVWNGSLWNQHDHLRSVNIEELRPLFGLPGIRWHSLQLGRKALERPAFVADYSGRLKSFEDTAALVANLDLVIAVDTAVANLAGAMGAKVWVLVETENDFRWGLEGDSSPWFPGARVFRQQNRRDWSTPLREIEAALRAETERV